MLLPRVYHLNPTDDLKRAYPDRFQGIWNFEGHFHITTDPHVTPVVQAPRRCPIALKDKESSTHGGDGGHFTSAKTNRLGLEFSLQPEIVREISNLPRPKGSQPSNQQTPLPHYDFAGDYPQACKSHSLLQAGCSPRLLDVSLDQESSMKTTFNSPFGRYRFLRLPFGLNLSQDVFQEKNHILKQCPGTISIADYVGVFGRTEDEHNANLHQLMRTAQKHDLVFNGDKCKIRTSKLHFFGLVFDANGVHPDPARIDVIRSMTKPADSD